MAIPWLLGRLRKQVQDFFTSQNVAPNNSDHSLSSVQELFDWLVGDYLCLAVSFIIKARKGEVVGNHSV